MTATEPAGKLTRPPQLYTGATTCDFRPEWEGLHGDGVALAEGCFKAKVGDHLPWLVLADWLDERDDDRGQWVRQFVHWEQFAQAGKFGRKKLIEWDDREKSFAEFTKNDSGWRWVGLWNAVAARWCPDGYGVGSQWETWVDELVLATNVWCVLWACRLVAGSQADAAGSQADLAGSQAYAAGRQADLAGSQAYAARSQAYAAGSQAYAAGSQAYAAGMQADAAGMQADAAEKNCRKWMMNFWSEMSAEFTAGV